MTRRAPNAPCPVCCLDPPGPSDEWTEVDCSTCGRNRFSTRAVYECRRLSPEGRRNVSRGLAAVRRLRQPVFDVRAAQIHALRDWPAGGGKLGS